MTDRELLELAAKAAGAVKFEIDQTSRSGIYFDAWPGEGNQYWTEPGGKTWNPLTNDGDALRLAAKLFISIDYGFSPDVVIAWNGKGKRYTGEKLKDDSSAATRRVIVHTAAGLGVQMLGSNYASEEKEK